MDLIEEVTENNNISLFKFADDGTVKIASESSDQCKEMLKTVVTSLENWTKSWRMIVNCSPNKTEYICFGTAENDADIPESILLSNKIVKRVKQTRVLGLLIDEKLTYIPQSEDVNKKLMGQWARMCQYNNIHWGLNQKVMTQIIKTFYISILQYSGHIWINPRNMDEINHLWYKLIKTSVGATFNIKLSIGEVILGVPPISIQTKMNQTKHYLKLNYKQMPEDKLRDFVILCGDHQRSQPPELKNALKDVYKYLQWKLTQRPSDFTENDVKIISDLQYSKYFQLSAKSCYYTKTCINKYTESIWFNKLRNVNLSEGDPHIPRPSCSKLPIPADTSRDEEVLLMSLFYPQNLFNSFVYRHTYCEESPLCPTCTISEQTAHHVICVCNNHSEEIRQTVRELVGEQELQQEDTTTLLNCSRDKTFLQLCLQTLREGNFRTHITL